MVNHKAPVITIDGFGGSGKGTIGHHLAEELHWHYLDSGSLYRVCALAAEKRGVSEQDPMALAALASTIQIKYKLENHVLSVFLDEIDVTEAIRAEECGQRASKISGFEPLRNALLKTQRNFQEWPGLVTDGRDMGTVIFPDASLKIFLTATLQERANRRFLQLKQKGIHANLSELSAELDARDKRDQTRQVAPTIPAKDAVVIDTTGLSIEQVLTTVRHHMKAKRVGS